MNEGLIYLTQSAKTPYQTSLEATRNKVNTDLPKVRK